MVLWDIWLVRLSEWAVFYKTILSFHNVKCCSKPTIQIPSCGFYSICMCFGVQSMQLQLYSVLNSHEPFLVTANANKQLYLSQWSVFHSQANADNSRLQLKKKSHLHPQAPGRTSQMCLHLYFNTTHPKVSHKSPRDKTERKFCCSRSLWT